MKTAVFVAKLPPGSSVWGLRFETFGLHFELKVVGASIQISPLKVGIQKSPLCRAVVTVRQWLKVHTGYALKQA